jgi:hypothetical protein
MCVKETNDDDYLQGNLNNHWTGRITSLQFHINSLWLVEGSEPSAHGAVAPIWIPSFRQQVTTPESTNGQLPGLALSLRWGYFRNLQLDRYPALSLLWWDYLGGIKIVDGSGNIFRLTMFASLNMTVNECKIFPKGFYPSL